MGKNVCPPKIHGYVFPRYVSSNSLRPRTMASFTSSLLGFGYTFSENRQVNSVRIFPFILTLASFAIFYPFFGKEPSEKIPQNALKRTLTDDLFECNNFDRQKYIEGIK